MNNNTKNSGIYKITNKNNGKFYIGSSKHLDRRWWEHQNDLIKNDHINPKLQHAWNYHGKDSFDFTIIETVEGANLFEREQFYLDTFKPHIIGYNISDKACGGDHLTNHPRFEEIKKHLSDINLNEKNPMYGKTHKPESIDKQKKAAIGRYSLQWFIDKNGVEQGTILYNERRIKLQNRKMNYVYDNGLTGKVRGAMSDENKKRISESKAAFKLRKAEFEVDLQSNNYTLQQLAEKYNVSKTLVKYYKRKL
jgi:group I intron endonuclease